MNTIRINRRTNGKMHYDINIGDKLLRSDIAKFSGGTDITGNPVITFPVLPGQEQQKWRLEDIENVLRYYVNVVQLILKRSSISFLANFHQGYSEEFLTNTVKSLQSIETDRRGTVAVFYVLKPRSKTKSSLLKKLLGLKKKKGEITFINQFRVVFLSNQAELHHQIEPSQLTVDYGGRLPYDHQAWAVFHKSVMLSLSQFEEISDKLREVRDRALLLQDYETHNYTVHQLENLKQELEQKFKALISESGVTSGIDRCKQTLHLLDHAAEEEPLCHLNQTVMMKVVTNVRRTYEEFTDINKELDTVWRSVDESLQTQIGLRQRKDDANELCAIITEQFWPNMMDHPKHASSLSQAEMNRTHFVTSLYEPAKEILSNATQILEDLQTIRISKQNDKIGLQDIVYRLSNTIHPLAGQLNELNEAYTAIHMFYITFEKSLLWYKEALDFIPNSLCGRAVNNRNRSACLPAPTGWRESVRAFLRKYQAPREDHMIELDTFVHPSIDKSTKTQARLLSNRIRVLINILFNAHLDITTLCNIHAWKQEKHSEFNEDPIRTPRRERYHESQYHEMPGRRRPMNTRLKRKINKSRTFRENEAYKDVTPVKRENTHKHVRSLSRSSSTDTELLTRDRNYSERYVCLASPDSGYKDYGTVRSMDDLRNDKVRKQSIDSLSVNSIDPDTDFEDSDNLIDCIQRVTSDWSISSDQKLHYVSNLLMSADTKNINTRNPVEPRYIPSTQISELNKRLTRSLGNIINMDNEDEFAPDTPTVESVSTGDIIDLKEKNNFDFETSDCIVAFPISYLNGHRYPFEQEEEEEEDDTAPETTDNVRERMYYEPSSHNSSPTSPDADSHKSLMESQRALEASLRRTDLLLKKIQMSSRLREQSRLRRLVSRGESMRAVKPDGTPGVDMDSTLRRKNSNVSSKRSLTSLSTDHGYSSSMDHVNNVHRKITPSKTERIVENGSGQSTRKDFSGNNVLYRSEELNEGVLLDNGDLNTEVTNDIEEDFFASGESISKV